MNPLIAIVQGKLGRFTEFESSMDKLRAHTMGVTGRFLSGVRSSGLNPAAGRNWSAKMLLKNPAYDCIIFVDDDQVLDSTTALRLCAMLDQGWDLAAPLIVKVDPPFQTVGWQRIDGVLVPFVPWGKTGIHEMSEIGTGVLAVKREVFVRLKKPWFQLGKLPRHPDYMGEDVFFTRAANKAGFKIGLDVNLPAGHTAPFTVWADVETDCVVLTSGDGVKLHLPAAMLRGMPVAVDPAEDL